MTPTEKPTEDLWVTFGINPGRCAASSPRACRAVPEYVAELRYCTCDGSEHGWSSRWEDLCLSAGPSFVDIENVELCRTHAAAVRTWDALHSMSDIPRD